jgi:hypothetical protein
MTGPNHSAGFSKSNIVYVWGHNSVNNRLGLKEPNQDNDAKLEPTQSFMIHNVIEMEKEQVNAKQV